MSTKKLGLVKAIHRGTVAPTNTTMLWYDTNTGVNRHKYYNTITSAWEVLAGSSSGTFKGEATPSTPEPSSPSEGDWYLVAEAGTIWGIANCEVGDEIHYVSGGWVLQNKDLYLETWDRKKGVREILQGTTIVKEYWDSVGGEWLNAGYDQGI